MRKLYVRLRSPFYFIDITWSYSGCGGPKGPLVVVHVFFGSQNKTSISARLCSYSQAATFCLLICFSPGQATAQRVVEWVGWLCVCLCQPVSFNLRKDCCRKIITLRVWRHSHLGGGIYSSSEQSHSTKCASRKCI